MTYSLIDRFCSKKIVGKNDYQLLGVVCLFIASKFEEIYYPKMKQLIMICNKAFTREQILLKEHEVMESLEYNITGVTVVDQLQSLQ